MASGKEYIVTETGWFKPGVLQQSEFLEAGEVGYIAAAIKNITDATVGDTVTLASFPAAEPLPGYKKYSRWYSVAFIPSMVQTMKI